MADKIVKFEDWCKSCVYSKADPDKDDNPCNNCLAIPANMDSHRPIFWKSSDPAKNKRNYA